MSDIDDGRPVNPTRLASVCGLSWNRVNGGDVLTWDQLMDLAEERYYRNKALRMAAQAG